MDSSKETPTIEEIMMEGSSQDVLSERLIGPEPDTTEHVSFDEELLQETWTKGEKQPNQYRDAPFAALFVLHLTVVVAVAFLYGLPAIDTNSNEPEEEEEDSSLLGMVWLCSVAVGASMLFSVFSLSIMTRFAERLIQISLWSSIVGSFLVAVACFVWQLWIPGVLASISCLFGVCYAYLVWHRIPFAAANLETGLTAVRQNGGVVFVAFGMAIVSVVFSTLWCLALLGVASRTDNQDEQEDITFSVSPKAMALFLLSFYWTSEVIKNLVHVTVAGVVGTWWFAPEEASSFCSTSIGDSLHRAWTYSFGSICFGSLLVALIQLLHHTVHHARTNGRDGLLLCMLECILHCLERLVQYFNKWAYIYVGIYGYDYLTAGANVVELFKARGWTTIILDQLVSRVLMGAAFVIGLLTGCLGVLLAMLLPSWTEAIEDESVMVIAFVVPFWIGTFMVFTLMSVVSSAVDTVIVVFAEAPSEFRANHPQLSQKMIQAWRGAYPDECGF